MIILYLTLKKKWFDMIASGEKTEEYREIKPYWNKRLFNRKINVVEFSNGYGNFVPKMMYHIIDVKIGTGNPSWGAEPNKLYYVIKLGDKII